jgi:hypothetical protein
MQNINVHLGSATQFSSRAGPRAPVLSSAPADRPAPPVSDAAARHCVAAHLSGASLPALPGRHARTRRTSPMNAALGPLPGDDRRSEPGPAAPLCRVAPPRPGPPPPLFPPHFPSAALQPSRSLPARASTRSRVPTPLRPLLSSARASPLLPAPGPPPPATGSPLSLVDSDRAPPPSAPPR